MSAHTERLLRKRASCSSSQQEAAGDWKRHRVAGRGGPGCGPHTSQNSVIGRRVFARVRDGTLQNGTIQAYRPKGSTLVYSVKFPSGETGVYASKDLIGEGFTQLQDTCIVVRQRVYVWLYHTQHSGVVEAINYDRHQALVALDNGDRLQCLITDLTLDPHQVTDTETWASSDQWRLPASAPCSSRHTGYASSSSLDQSMDSADTGYAEDEEDVRAAEVLSLLQSSSAPSGPPHKQKLPCNFRCLHEGCEKTLSTALGIKRHICARHVGNDTCLSTIAEGLHYAKVPAVEGVGDGSVGTDATGRIQSAKCRKLFGLNKDQWCTKCRWKKACERVDQAKL